VRTLATKAVNARHREIDRRAFFVSTQSFAGFYRSVPLRLPNPPRSLFEKRFPSLERNPQGCARTCEQSVPNSLTLSFRGSPELTQSSRSESERKRFRTARLGVVLRPNLPQASTGSEKRRLDLVSATAFHIIVEMFCPQILMAQIAMYRFQIDGGHFSPPSELTMHHKTKLPVSPLVLLNACRKTVRCHPQAAARPTIKSYRVPCESAPPSKNGSVSIENSTPPFTCSWCIPKHMPAHTSHHCILNSHCASFSKIFGVSG